jgi:type VI secretion system protein VasD
MVIYPSSGMRIHLVCFAFVHRALAGPRLGLIGVLSALGLALAGCTEIPFMKPDPTRIEAAVVASLQANPDARKRASPVVVRVYELKSRAQFDATDFITLFERDKDALGSELVARDEFVLRPGETKDLAKLPAPETKFLAVLVGFRDLEKARSRAVVAVLPNVTNRWVIKIEPLSVAILPAPPK